QTKWNHRLSVLPATSRVVIWRPVCRLRDGRTLVLENRRTLSGRLPVIRCRKGACGQRRADVAESVTSRT
ncbi:MAG TPA: hypothetical protein PKH81_03695, partial [Treponemataceae bacterium]|nr:hypothetical protein [Treponemataceae bacterium]